MGWIGLTRRGFLGTSLAAAVSPWLAARGVAAKSQTGKGAGNSRLFLFVDWFHVQKGDMKVSLDPARISADGKKLLETYDRDLGKKFEQSGHRLKFDAPFGVRITPETAERTEPWLVADQPWERSISSPTVLFDEGKYRCWYTARLTNTEQKSATEHGRVMEVTGSALAYAESTDGVKWVKPSLKILSHQGSLENNLVSPFSNGGSVFRDDHGPPEERYKSFVFDKLPEEAESTTSKPNAKYGLCGITSPDGYYWTKNPKPLVRYFADTTNIAAWDSGLEKYVGYFRYHLGGRAISRCETTDFWNWPEPQPVLYSGPLDAPADDYYTNCFTTYPDEPSLRLLFPAIYHHDDDSVDIRLAVSRDGRVFSWATYDSVIKLGAPGEWDSGSLYANPRLVHLPDGRLALPYSGFNTTHNEAWFQNFYGESDTKCGFAWALWKDARLAGIEAKEYGVFAMQSTGFGGEKIEINARTARSGSVEVELRQRGATIPGFGFEDCVPLGGDAVWHSCQWKNGADVASLRGKSFEVRFRLQSAKVFACKFA